MMINSYIFSSYKFEDIGYTKKFGSGEFLLLGYESQSTGPTKEGSETPMSV
jgi:hypothetical protein